MADSLVKRRGKDEKDGDKDKRKRDGKESTVFRKKRRGPMKRKHLPHQLFALEGMSDAMEDFLAGRISFSYFEDVTQDPFWEDYRENDRRDFEGLHFPDFPPVEFEGSIQYPLIIEERDAPLNHDDSPFKIENIERIDE
eukprot:TRINITY_DN5891_c0_g1_i1.p1 TRINITY_DN5891_c0_g1~~TRINITY_DN5891_c0_g1_i1.p1  ORF type:complete len:139 (+),score=43.82 TRINITY_DN5891_c0_g1_i1:114-530(+)